MRIAASGVATYFLGGIATHRAQVRYSGGRPGYDVTGSRADVLERVRAEASIDGRLLTPYVSRADGLFYAVRDIPLALLDTTLGAATTYDAPGNQVGIVRVTAIAGVL